ncbi:MAG: 4-alpha-glucanotransferase [Roseiflexaceae bacterium]|nr:4-alpha-glucanotransferase [Roseiflexaceae bacterium]
MTTRASGILLHPTSLPSHWGIGDLGASAFQFVDFLAQAGQQLWQVMPLGPTGYGDSPYQCFSSFAGNTLLISPDLLLADGLLEAADVADRPYFPDDHVDYGWIIPYKNDLLRRSFARFTASASPELRDEYAAFRANQSRELDEYALFAALKAAHGGAAWNTWEPALAKHEPAAIEQARNGLVAEEYAFQTYAQWLFFRQWVALKQYANAQHVQIIGDIPIFVAYDSADVWANPDLFFLDDVGNPIFIAGVPPDYFSATGQLWGNPLFRWDVLAEQGYAWWIERVRVALTLFDIIRIDHFRGFAAYWEIPAGEDTAINGRWAPGPGGALFSALEQALGKLPIIAEDLGVITPDVEEIRDGFGLPGMKVLQFGFGGTGEDPYLPHNHIQNCVVYTGTHDNDTTLGWWRASSDHERTFTQMYLGRDGSDISWDLIRIAFMSVADTAIVPMQDVFGLGTEARMNLPGRLGGNWNWRYLTDDLHPELAERLHLLTRLYGRLRKLDTVTV